VTYRHPHKKRHLGIVWSHKGADAGIDWASRGAYAPVQCHFRFGKPIVFKGGSLTNQPTGQAEKLKATELRNNAIHLRKKALRKAEKTHTFAQEILKQNEAKITELKSTDRSGLVTAEALKWDETGFFPPILVLDLWPGLRRLLAK